MSSKKYQSEVLEENGQWIARINRRLSSRKSKVSKEQGGFSSESEAQAWADEALSEFINTQQTANSRQGESRKLNDEVKRQRSNRRSEKTELAKQAKEQAALDQGALDNQSSEAESDQGFDDYSDFEES